MKAKNTIMIILIILLIIFNYSVFAQHHKPQKAKSHDPHLCYEKLLYWGHTYKVVPNGAYVYTHAGERYHYNGVYYKAGVDDFGEVRFEVVGEK